MPPTVPQGKVRKMKGQDPISLAIFAIVFGLGFIAAMIFFNQQYLICNDERGNLTENLTTCLEEKGFLENTISDLENDLIECNNDKAVLTNQLQECSINASNCATELDNRTDELGLCNSGLQDCKNSQETWKTIGIGSFFVFLILFPIEIRIFKIEISGSVLEKIFIIVSMAALNLLFAWVVGFYLFPI